MRTYYTTKTVRTLSGLLVFQVSAVLLFPRLLDRPEPQAGIGAKFDRVVCDLLNYLRNAIWTSKSNAFF
jgi:hypothetical protein